MFSGQDPTLTIMEHQVVMVKLEMPVKAKEVIIRPQSI